MSWYVDFYSYTPFTEALAPRQSIKAGNAAQNKAARLNAAKQQRDRQRSQLLEVRRASVPPLVVAIIPLSKDVDVGRIWSAATAACLSVNEDDSISEGDAHMKGVDCTDSLKLMTLNFAERKRAAFTFVPPVSTGIGDPMDILDIGRCADAIILAVSGTPGLNPIDEDGVAALTVLRALGAPSMTAVVQLAGGETNLKERSAAKKRALGALEEHIGGEHRIMAADTVSDFRAVLRHIADSAHDIPHWRRHRPTLMAEQASYDPSTNTLLLDGWIRVLGMSVNSAVHIPGIGDFQLDQIDALPAGPGSGRGRANISNMELDMVDEPRLLARASPEQRESLERENEVDSLAGEQTWPTEAELAQAEDRVRKRRLPPGTSEYQAAWILDEDSDFEDEEDDGSDSMPDLEPIDDVDGMEGTGLDILGDDATEFGMDDVDQDDVDEDLIQAAKEKRRAEADDTQFPDEIDTPAEVPARKRFEKYRGLKSFRTSPWDPRESLPLEYAKVFAFENPKRTAKRAKEAALNVGIGLDGSFASAGAYVRLHVANVPSETANDIVSRVQVSNEGRKAPLVVTGLLQHETKLSVVNFALSKVSNYSEPIVNKERLLFVTGIRSFMARPVFSSDEHGADKFKMERFLHEGRSTIASLYAPISYGPLPILAFTLSADGGHPQLVATGTLRSCDPDRVVLKKIVLSGFPVKVHKVKAVVRHMFHCPEDIRWFKPVELWTKHGRRGRIREPVGTHGSMKCIFDGPVKQQDGVCMSLYKRVYPKWPEDMRFAVY